MQARLVVAAQVISFVVLIVAGSTYHTGLGTLRTPDFVHLYTIGTVARAGDAETLYDHEALHRTQGQLVAPAAGLIFPPLYPPQTALLVAPLSVLPFRWAALTLIACSAALYGLLAWLLWRTVRVAIPDGALVATVALASPGLWSLLDHGQLSIVPFTGFALAGLALVNDRRVLAGVALGLLGFKPQFALAVFIVLLVSREWRILAGLAGMAVAQSSLAAAWFGPSVFLRYLQATLNAVAQTASLDGKPFQTHTIGMLTRLLPPAVGVPLWLLTMAAIIGAAAWVWRSDLPVRVRFGVLTFAAVIASPHLFAYDLTMLILPVLWIGAWVETEAASQDRRVFWGLVHLLIVLVFLPTAAVVPIQASVFVLLGLFGWSVRHLTRAAAEDGARLGIFLGVG